MAYTCCTNPCHTQATDGNDSRASRKYGLDELLKIQLKSHAGTPGHKLIYHGKAMLRKFKVRWSPECQGWVKNKSVSIRIADLTKWLRKLLTGNL